jgi:hypothetical protein
VPRGRQYYDPIIQAPSRVESAGNRRVELYPEHDIRDNVERPRWVARLIGEDGLIVQHSPGSFEHDDALRQAQEMWPGLEVFELREESEDSTWDGMGPSPRLWQSDPASYISDEPTVVQISRDSPMGGNITPVADEQPQLHAIQVSQPGTYVRLDDVLAVLEGYAAQFDGENNPSAALGLREAASALREAF